MSSQRSGLKRKSFRSVITKRKFCRTDAITNVDDNTIAILKRTRKSQTSSVRKTLNIFKNTQVLSFANDTSQSGPEMKLGFILGEKIFGWQILNNLLGSGYKLTVCLLGFSEEVERKLLILGAEIVSTPLEVWRKADLIFSFSPSAQHAKALIFGEYNVLQQLNPSKYFIEMTCIDADTSHEIDSIMKAHGIKYLEAQIQGSLKDAASGYLVILTAGDETLFSMCQHCFEVIGCQSFFFGNVGSACKINLIIKMMSSICIAGLAQGLALIKHFGFRIDDLLEVICMTSLSSALIMDKGKCMIKGQYEPEMILNQMQCSLSSVQRMAEEVQHPIPITTTVNEKFKECILLGLGAKDVSAIFQTF